MLLTVCNSGAASTGDFFKNLDVLKFYLLNIPDPSPVISSNGRSSRRVRVGIIDTGIDISHPSMQAARMLGRLKGFQS
jgi:hypothetical protein